MCELLINIHLSDVIRILKEKSTKEKVSITTKAILLNKENITKDNTNMDSEGLGNNDF